MPTAPPEALPSKQLLSDLLTEARERTLLLISGLSDEDLHRQHDPLMSPIIWDVGHIAHFEELWLTRNLSGPIEFSEMPGMYNPLEHPRAERAALPLPTLREMLERLREIRARVLDRLDALDWDEGNPLLKEGFVYHMVLQHEYQHDETILQTLQLKKGAPYAAPRAARHPAVAAPASGMVRFQGGEVTIGTDDTRAAYDNERPRHRVVVQPFAIDRAPVTNGRYLEFITDGGYTRPELWSGSGWQWLTEAQAIAPKYWNRDGASWTERVMDLVRPIDHARPVCHVC
ncbi:MAG: DinB family protein, partial [Gemmatimonadota bacterium]|nr:DinB family protein [Gemmatimonadota bacterium]